jgi:hypothetical protein
MFHRSPKRVERRIPPSHAGPAQYPRDFRSRNKEKLQGARTIRSPIVQPARPSARGAKFLLISDKGFASFRADQMGAD